MASEPDLSGVSLLIVNDDDSVREGYRSLLEGFGADVTTASSGRIGWERFQVERFDAVISDIEMRDGDGYELVRRIRALPPDAGGLTPVIAASFAKSAVDSFEAGFHAHLDKPSDFMALPELVQSFVRESPVSGASWTLTQPATGVARLKFVGHPTAADMRRATAALAKLLEFGPQHVVVDLREVTGFDQSVGSVAERTAWRVRRRISGATIIGGSLLARMIAKAACMTLGTKVSFVADWSTDP